MSVSDGIKAATFQVCDLCSFCCCLFQWPLLTKYCLRFVAFLFIDLFRPTVLFAFSRIDHFKQRNIVYCSLPSDSHCPFEQMLLFFSFLLTDPCWTNVVCFFLLYFRLQDPCWTNIVRFLLTCYLKNSFHGILFVFCWPVT